MDSSKRQNGETSNYLKTSEGERWFNENEQARWMQAADEVMAKQGEINLGFTVGGRFANLLYFPSQAVLERYGVKGLRSYSYPASEAEFKQLPIYMKYEKTNFWVADF